MKMVGQCTLQYENGGVMHDATKIQIEGGQAADTHLSCLKHILIIGLYFRLNGRHQDKS